MNYSNIKLFDPANGFGLRTVLFVSGCTHACPGCFNAMAQDFNAGLQFTDDTIDIIIDSLKNPGVQGLTVLGGEPMDPNNQGEVSRLILKVREEFGDTKDIWVWTGYIYPRDFDPDHIRPRALTQFTNSILSNIDVLVDGPFIAGQCDLRLRFRGSYNQRIIDMNKSTIKGDIALVDVGETKEDLNEIKEAINRRNKARSKYDKSAR